jgi:sugar lactone lactonase YvrE
MSLLLVKNELNALILTLNFGKNEYFLLFIEQLLSVIPDNMNTKWIENGTTIAGGNGKGQLSNQLNSPNSISIADDQTMYISDSENYRIVKWEYGAKDDQVVAGGNGKGSRIDQFNQLIEVIVDKKNDAFITCDYGNTRVVRWSCQNRTNPQIIISKIHCRGLTMDNNGDLYVSNFGKDEVRRWSEGDKTGTIVAGGNQGGNGLNQLSWPTSIFVDQDHSVYVLDDDNYRVMKWVKDATVGIIVAGRQGEESGFDQLRNPSAVIVDHLGDIYVSDSSQHHILCWSNGSREGSIVLGGNGRGKQPNQFNGPDGLSFDRQGYLYVVDRGNHRIQKFVVDLS